MKKKLITPLVCAVFLLLVYAVYSRPMTVTQLYPALTLDHCTAIHVSYEVAPQTEKTEAVVEKDSEAYRVLCDLLYGQSYCRRLRDLLPRGTRIHPTQPGDFQWEALFFFEDVSLPDGSVGSGAMLRIQYWYGELDIHFAGETRACRTSGQEAWAEEVLNVLP